VKTWLVDTGPVVAYLDADDSAHVDVAARWDSFRGLLVTTSVAIVEAMHFVNAGSSGARHLADLVAASGMEVYDISRPPELYEAASLMEKYSDTPMDYADATLVLLAEALEVRDVLTLDRRGFSTYRMRKRHAFRLVLDLE
jgi:hypothetical protein